MKNDVHFFAACRKVAGDVPVANGEVAFPREIKKSVLNVLVCGGSVAFSMWAPSEVLVGEVVGDGAEMTVAASSWCSEAPGDLAKAETELLPHSDNPLGLAHEGSN